MHSIARLGLSALLAAACSAAWAQEKIKFGTGSALSLTSAPLTMGISMGYFKAEGLEVEVVPFRGGSGVLIPQIVNKSIQVGFPTLDPLMVARQPGRDYMPLKFFYNVTRTSIYEIVVLESSPTKRIADLKGKKIGVGALSWGNIPITKAMLRDDGAADAELIAVGQGAAAYQSLTSGRIDALNLFDVPHAELEGLGTKIRRLPVADKFNNLGSNSLIAHEDTIKGNPKMLVGVGRAMAKATLACHANVAACVKAFWAMYPEQKPTAGSEDEKLANGVRVLGTRLDKMLAFQGGERNFGEFAPQMFRDWIEVLHGAGQLSTTEIPVDSLYTNQFVKDFNQFDAAAVLREAKALK
jgi:NitT/TauT family transport system substrate-binding protein